MEAVEGGESLKEDYECEGSCCVFWEPIENSNNLNSPFFHRKYIGV